MKLENLLTKDKPSLNDWSFRIPGIILFCVMIYLENQTKAMGTCSSEIKIMDGWFQASSFISFAYVGLGMFLMPYLLILIAIAKKIFYKLKGIKENDDTDLPNS